MKKKQQKDQRVQGNKSGQNDFRSKEYEQTRKVSARGGDEDEEIEEQE